MARRILAWHIACMGEKNAYRILVGKLVRKRHRETKNIWGG
jgi:hypothetical protein